MIVFVLSIALVWRRRCGESQVGFHGLPLWWGRHGVSGGEAETLSPPSTTCSFQDEKKTVRRLEGHMLSTYSGITHQ